MQKATTLLLFVLLVWIAGCNTQHSYVQRIKDSIWPVIVYDSVYSLDSAGQQYWGHSFDPTKHIHKRVTDSSQWFLMNIQDTADFKLFTYYRLLPYEYITDGGWDDLVGRWESQYLRTDRLLYPCKITDTIPTAEHMVRPNDSTGTWTYSTEYYIGGIFGHYVRSVVDSVVAYPKNQKP